MACRDQRSSHTMCRQPMWALTAGATVDESRSQRGEPLPNWDSSEIIYARHSHFRNSQLLLVPFLVSFRCSPHFANDLRLRPRHRSRSPAPSHSGRHGHAESPNSDWAQSAISDDNGEFKFTSVPLGNYSVTVRRTGFAQTAGCDRSVRHQSRASFRLESSPDQTRMSKSPQLP